jgi:hypothetical protein
MFHYLSCFHNLIIYIHCDGAWTRVGQNNEVCASMGGDALSILTDHPIMAM